MTEWGKREQEQEHTGSLMGAFFIGESSMTISYPSSGARVEVDGDGVSSSVTLPFAFWVGSDLRIIHTDASGVDVLWGHGVDFTVSGGEGDTGSIGFSPSKLIGGEKLTILLADQGDQMVSFNAGQLLPSTIETGLDRLTSRLQGVKEQVSRLVGFKESSRTSAPTLPEPSADGYLGWNETGSDLENKPALSVGTVSDVAEGGEPGVTLNADGSFDFDLPVGATGATGTPGTPGGPQGEPGIEGEQGEQGEAGVAGAAGVDGAVGAAGSDGVDGSTGATGAAGVAGVA
ncbi:MAG: hypothetical protein JKY34_10985, partial [Kordiimonadaceae bacterium]|nr:hypothetical protein [Kordiimonadaceae bacterium]